VLQTETRLVPSLFQIDLNADLGEATGQWEGSADQRLLRLVSSASIACGGHAGSPERMRRTAAEAALRGVSIGAHPGYPDREGFGRRELDLGADAIRATVAEQVATLAASAGAEGAKVRYVKPHGALYNRAARDLEAAHAVAVAIRSIDPTLAVLAPPRSALLDAARSVGLHTASEAFLDRGYDDDGTLIPRDRPGAFVHDPSDAADRALTLVRNGTVTTARGTQLSIQADSLCVHGDGARAVELVFAVRARLTQAGVLIAPFCR
jgi:UPF0271 protein